MRRPPKRMDVLNELVHGWPWRVEGVIVEPPVMGNAEGVLIVRNQRITGLSLEVITELTSEIGPL